LAQWLHSVNVPRIYLSLSDKLVVTVGGLNIQKNIAGKVSTMRKTIVSGQAIEALFMMISAVIGNGGGDYN